MTQRQQTFDQYWDDIAGEGNRESFDDSLDTFDEFADEAHGTPFNGEPIVHEEEAPDVGISPEEAFLGTGAVSRRHSDTRDQPVEKGAWGDVTPERDEARIAEIARRDRMEERQQQDRQRMQQQSGGVEPVSFERQRPTGRMAPVNVTPDHRVPVDRGPKGRFVSSDRTPVQSIGRRQRDGVFTRHSVNGRRQDTRDEGPGELSDEALDAGIAVAGFVKHEADPMEFEGDTFNLGGTTQAPMASAQRPGETWDPSEGTVEDLRHATNWLETEHDEDPRKELEGYDEFREAIRR